jgi:hypothetical protein
LRQWLETTEPRPVEARRDLDHAAPPAAGRGMKTAAATAAVALAADAGALTFVAMVSNDGPWELRSLLVNDFQVLDKTIPATERRLDVPIPAVFGPQLAITWSILAGQLIPTVATFVQESGQEPVLLAQKNALKKGESWAPLGTVPFPPA